MAAYNGNHYSFVTCRYFDDSLVALVFNDKDNALTKIDDAKLTSLQIDTIIYLDGHYIANYSYNPNNSFEELKYMRHYTRSDFAK